MNCGEHKLIGSKPPENHDTGQHQSQQTELPRCDGENISNQVSVILGEAAAANCGNKDAERNRCTGKHTDNGVRCLVTLAADKGKQKREGNRKNHSDPGGTGYAADAADGNTGEGRMTQRIREEAHASGYDHRGAKAEQRPHKKHCQQGILHKIPVKYLERKDIPKTVPQ